ncbi:MAG: 3-dehydrosphinganine reductase [Geoglossum umbratile]|nr:MAG: 3-dehydrosphinganine reductase [Geoglossum umbratile]
MEISGSPWQSVLISLLAIAILAATMGFLGSIRKNHFPVDGRTVIITGGSQGMGLCVAKLLARKGASVVIVARDVEKLKAALVEISSAASKPATQRFHYISADLKTPSESTRIVSEVTTWNNNTPPDIVWCAAGSSRPGLFLNMDTEHLREQMDSNYWSAAYLAHAILKPWLQPSTADTRKPTTPQPPRHLVFTSSVLGFYPIVGYTQYAPTKAALRSLSDSLIQELNLYHPTVSPTIRVSTVFPATIFTPGYTQENLTKPHITKQLEEEDGGQTPDQVAAISVRALEKGEYLITTGLLGSAMRGAAWAGSPRNSRVRDTLMAWATGLVWLFVQPDMDRKVRKYGKKHGHPSKYPTGVAPSP